MRSTRSRTERITARKSTECVPQLGTGNETFVLTMVLEEPIEVQFPSWPSFESHINAEVGRWIAVMLIQVAKLPGETVVAIGLVR